MYFQSLVVMQVSKRKKEKRHLREVKSKKEEKLERKKKQQKKSESIILQLHVLCCDVIGDDVMYFSNN